MRGRIIEEKTVIKNNFPGRGLFPLPFAPYWSEGRSMKTVRLTRKSTRNALLAALMTASLILALSIDGVVSSAQSGFEGDYDLSFAANGYFVNRQDPGPSATGDQNRQFKTGDVMSDESIVVGGAGRL